MKFSAPAVTLLLVMLAHPASAFPARSLVGICEDGMPDLEHSACTFYILGVLDGYRGSYNIMIGNSSGGEFSAADHFKESLRYCLPYEQDRLILVRKVIGHLIAHPEVGNLPAEYAVILALRDAFPCKGD